MAIYTYVRNSDPSRKITGIELQGGLILYIHTYADLSPVQLQQIYSSGTGIVLEKGIIEGATSAEGSPANSDAVVIPNFEPVTEYEEYQVIAHNTETLRAKKTFVSGEEFDEEDWESIGGGGGGGGGGHEEEKVVGPAETIAQLNSAYPAGVPDGEIGTIRLGTGGDQEDVELFYDSLRKKWISLEHPIIRTTDQLGPSVQFFNGSQLGRNFVTTFGTGAWWNFTSPHRLNGLMSAGLTIEYRVHGFMVQDSNGASMKIITYIYQVNDTDPNPEIFERPIEGGWAETGAIEGGGAQTKADYQWKTTPWEQLKAAGGGALTAATKTSMYPVLVGFVNHDGTGEPSGDGHVIDYCLFMRFVG